MDQAQYIKKDLKKLYILLILIAVAFGTVLYFDHRNGFVDRVAARLHNATLISN
jgi:hypothetical protein